MLWLYTLHIIHWVSIFHELCSFVFPFYHYLSLCCNKSKSIDSINALYTSRCLVISSILLSCRFIGLFIWSVSSSLWALVFVQWKRRWSIVWYSLPQTHINPMSCSKPKYTAQSPVLNVNSLFNDRFMFQWLFCVTTKKAHFNSPTQPTK